MRSVIIDTNLLILLVVGLTSKRYITTHKRLKQFTVEDFEKLISFIIGAEIVSTPNILTETSNMIDGGLLDPARTEVVEVFRQVISKINEVYCDSVSAATRVEFGRLGLADTVSISLAGADALLLTVDVEMYLEAQRQNRNVINFRHVLEET